MVGKYTSKELQLFHARYRGMIEALSRDDTATAADLLRQLSLMRKTNPDWIGTSMDFAGGLLSAIPEPRAKLIGGALQTASFIRKQVKRI